MFVLVGSPEAQRSYNVDKEIREFLMTRRTLIPIRFGVDGEAAVWSDRLVGLAFAKEPIESLRQGIVSDAVLKRISNSFSFRRRDQRLQLLSTIMLAILGLLLVLSAAAGVYGAREAAGAAVAAKVAREKEQIAIQKTREAQAESRRADNARQLADQKVAEAAEASKRAQDAQKLADQKTAEAAEASKRAQDAQKLADQKTAEAAQASKQAEAASKMAEAERQIAVARRLANQADALASQQPTETRLVTLLAIESVRRFPAVEGQTVLERTLGILPGSVTELHGIFREDVTTIQFSTDGQLVAGTDGWHVNVWEAKTARLVDAFDYNDTHVPGPVVQFSADTTYLATAHANVVTLHPLSSAAMPGEPKHRALTLKHRGDVYDVTFHPKQPWLVTAGAGGIVMWDFSGHQLKIFVEFDEDSPRPRRVLFNGNGSILAASAKGQLAQDSLNITVWDTATGQSVAAFEHPGGPGRYRDAFDINDDGDLVATGNSDGSVRVWNVKTKSERFSSRGHEGVSAVKLSRDGSRLAAAYWDFGARIWDLRMLREVAQLVHAKEVENLDFSQDGHYVVTGGYDRTARVWDVKTGIEVQRLPHGKNAMYPAKVAPVVAFNKGASQVASANIDQVYIWQIHTLDRLRSVEVGSWIESVSLGPLAKFVATRQKALFQNGLFRLWNVDSGDMVDFKESLPSLPLFSTHGQLILTLGPGSNAAIWNPVTGRKVTAISDSARVLSGAFDPAGDLAVTGTLDGISVWKTQTGESLYSRSCTNVQSVRFTADSAYAVGVGSDRIVRIQLATGQTTESVIPGRTNDVRDSVSENGLFVLRRGHIRQDSFADQDMGKSARVYEAATGRQVCYVPPEEPDGVEHTSVWLSSQGTYLATVDRSNRILVRNTSNCREASQVQLGSDIAAFTFEPDEKYFATLTEDDRALRVWDLASGREISRRILATEPYYKYISFSPDGIFLASIESVETATGLPGKVRMWGWRPEDAAAAACERLTSNLSTTEWVRYFQGEPYRKTCDNLALPK